MLRWAGTDNEIRELVGSETETTDASGGIITSGPDRAGEGAGPNQRSGTCLLGMGRWITINGH